MEWEGKGSLSHSWPPPPFEVGRGVERAHVTDDVISTLVESNRKIIVLSETCFYHLNVLVLINLLWISY